MREQGWTRRAALGAIGAAGVSGALAACEWLPARELAAPPPDPLEPLLDGTRALAARYAEVLAAYPELAWLRPLHEAHLAHVEALLAAIGRPELASPASPASPTGARWVPASPAPAQTTVEDAVAGLREAEHYAQGQAVLACLNAPAPRAALLGSIAAARATHLEVLA